MWVVSGFVCDFDAACTMAAMRNAPMSPMRDEIDYSGFTVCRGTQAKSEGKYSQYEGAQKVKSAPQKKQA